MTDSAASVIGGERRVRWLDSIPPRWGVVPSKWLFSHVKERARPDDEQLTASQDDGVIPQAEFIRRAGRQVMQVFLNPEILKHVEQDDFVISMRSFQGGLERSWARGCISSAYVILRPNDGVHVPFFAHLFKSTAYIQALQATSNLVRDGQALRFDNFCMVHLPRVPLDEQKAIADFLDRKTAAIDALIAKKQRLLALLAEKRAALINQAVTKGLDPSVPMKDSGIPWIGEIPAHWEVKRLKFACVLQRGFDLPSQARVEGDVPIYGGGGVTGHHDTAMVDPPGVVTGRYGTVGEVHLVEVPFWPLNTSLYVRDFWGNDAAYVRYLLSAVPIKMYSAKSAVPGVDRNDVHVIPVGLPKLMEQRAILALLRSKLRGLDSVAEGTTVHIDRLQEYRQALITAAVTGQLDITGEAA